MSFDHRRRGATSEANTENRVSPTVGKRTLTEQLPAAPVQLAAAHGAATAPAKETARQGLSGPSGPLPHIDSIQRAFGRHDLSQVKAHIGGEAATATQRMGAQAYATGDHLAFPQYPDLHLAAHEAAHVVQQRGGVQLAGGVGLDGDPYERHADAVADHVVQGKSAEALLDIHAGEGAAAQGQGAVQRKDDPALAAFKSKKHAVTNHGPSTGRGAFDAEYEANTGELTITLELKFTKEDDGASAWTAAEIATWKSQYQTAMQARWGGRYTMQCTKPGWESLIATTKIVVAWVDKDPHFELKVKKMGAGSFRPDSAVTQPGGQDRSAHAPGTYATPSSQGTTRLGDTDVTERDKNKWTANTIATEVKRANSANPKTVTFAESSDAVAGSDRTKLGQLGTILAMIKQPKMSVAVDGFAAAGEGDKAPLSQQRADHVKQTIEGAGSQTHAFLATGKGDAGADATAAWRKVTIRIGNADAGWKNDYDIAGHETGHMFGFDEEYQGGTKESTHYKLVEEALGTQVADTFVKRKAGEDSASVMDGGLDVRPYHYVTFWEALGRCTEPDLKRTDWKIQV